MLAQDLVHNAGRKTSPTCGRLHSPVARGRCGCGGRVGRPRTRRKLARDKELSDACSTGTGRFVSRMLLLTAPDKPVFVAIGALHLGGKRGVLDLLRRRGFVVEAG